jgi:hypothetical protein
MVLLGHAQNAAEELLRADPLLKAPENRRLAKQIERLFELNASGMN